MSFPDTSDPIMTFDLWHLVTNDQDFEPEKLSRLMMNLLNGTFLAALSIGSFYESLQSENFDVTNEQIHF